MRTATLRDDRVEVEGEVGAVGHEVGEYERGTMVNTRQGCGLLVVGD